MPAKKHQPAKMELNLTSMLDVIFQLIIFFLLVSNMSSAELPKLEPPAPTQSQAQDSGERSRVIINLIPADNKAGGIKSVRVGQEDILPGNFGRLTQMLKAEQVENPEIQVDLRADLTVNYKEVQPVMTAITSAGISRINLVALTDTDK